LLAQTIGAVVAPLATTAGLLQASLRDAASLLQALIDRRAAEGGEAAAQPA
jgi:hypothetical protein